MDPLVIEGRVGELLNLLLRDRHVRAVPEVLADMVLDIGDALDRCGHANSVPEHRSRGQSIIETRCGRARDSACGGVAPREQYRKAR
jgi:hypothetical protein